MTENTPSRRLRLRQKQAENPELGPQVAGLVARLTEILGAKMAPLEARITELEAENAILKGRMEDLVSAAQLASSDGDSTRNVLMAFLDAVGSLEARRAGLARGGPVAAAPVAAARARRPLVDALFSQVLANPQAILDRVSASGAQRLEYEDLLENLSGARDPLAGEEGLDEDALTRYASDSLYTRPRRT